VLAIQPPRDLDEALALQNAVDYGLTAGLHSLDADEIAHWVENVQAGNLYVNRGTTGAIVQRQPFGGWKKSVVGPGTKAGGPNYLLGLGSFRSAEAAPADGVVPARLAGILDAFTAAERAYLERAVGSDLRAQADEFAVTRDVSALSAERNAFRYRAVPVTVRAERLASPLEVARVVLAGLAAGAPVAVSAPSGWAPAALAAFRTAGVPVVIEDEPEWHATARALRDARVRLIGGSAAALLEAIGGRPDVAVYDSPVTEAGRVEQLPFLREQAISVTAHRFGTPSPLVDAVPLTASVVE